MIFKFKDGELAHRRGRPRAECPHDEDSREGAEWLAGWDAEQDAANHYAETMLRRDQHARHHGRPEHDRDTFGATLKAGT